MDKSDLQFPKQGEKKERVDPGLIREKYKKLYPGKKGWTSSRNRKSRERKKPVKEKGKGLQID